MNPYIDPPEPETVARHSEVQDVVLHLDLFSVIILVTGYHALFWQILRTLDSYRDWKWHDLVFVFILLVWFLLPMGILRYVPASFEDVLSYAFCWVFSMQFNVILFEAEKKNRSL